MKRLILITTLVFAFAMQAQATPLEVEKNPDIERQAFDLAMQIGRQGQSLALGQRQQIAADLQAVGELVAGHSRPKFACVSRDNDGRSPWALGLRNGVDVKQLGVVYASVDECEAAKRESRMVRTSTLMCVSRDRDGRAPWVVGALDGSGAVTLFRATVTQDLPSCAAFLKRFVIAGDAALFCGSRDDDGRAPFVPASVDLSTLAVTKGSTVFTTVEKCWEFVQER